MPGIAALLAIFVFFTLPVQLSANVPGPRKSRLQSIQERAANVKRQFTEHQRQVTLAQRELKTRTPAGVPPKVSMQYNKLFKTSSSTFFYDDMESGTNGWAAVSPADSAAWHRTTLDANSPTHSWWPGIEEQKNYVTGARVHEELISPAINLTGATGNVTLLFTENYFTEAGFDFCMVDVTTDGGTSWTHLRGGYAESPSGDSYGWKVSTLDLTAYADQTINLRFVFDTGDSLFNAFPGWFVDNVAVFDQSGWVSGRVYYDQNQNGILDAGERGLANWLVTVTGPLTITMQISRCGTFNIPLPLGSYQFSEVIQTPWTQTSTPTTMSAVLDTSGARVNNINFGNYRLGCLILGNVFEDLNKDSLFTPGEPPFMDPWIELDDSSYSWIDDTQPDSLGQFAFFVFGSGRYHITEYLPSHWVSTIPPSRQYSIVVPPKDTVFSGFLFGSYELPPQYGAIRGFVFNDLNRNGAMDDREPALENRSLTLYDTVRSWLGYTTTDSSGRFSFEDLAAGKYVVQLNGVCGWHQSTPSGNFSTQLDSGQVKDSVMFGSYVLLPGSISGTAFNDTSADGVREPGEPALSGNHIYLSGFHCNGSRTPNVNMSTVTDDSGHYRFEGLGTGTYHIRIVMSTHWRQTLPTSFQPQTVALGDEENRTGTDFGLTYDSTFNLAFRSFLPEAIAYVNDHIGKGHPGTALKVQSIGSQATFTLITPISGLNGLHVEFSQTIDTSNFTVSHFPRGTHDVKFRKWEFKLEGADTLERGDSVVIFAVSYASPAKQVLIPKYWWVKGPLSPAPYTVVIRNTYGDGRFLLPMPNVMNVLQTMYTDGLPTRYGLTVGLVPHGHSAYASTAAAVWKSLYQNGHLHMGHPRCLGVFSNTLTSIKSSVSTLTPTKGNNILFAEALTLKANIYASEFGITPYGFGGLIFHGDTANPFNGLSVSNISIRLDSAISKYVEPTRKPIVAPGYCVCDTNYFNMAYWTIRMIDSAFSGPIDTLSFVSGLILKPFRDLSQVPFLTIDSAFSSLAAGITPHGGSYVQEPLQYKLEQNYPNPFNPTTTFSFTLKQTSFVTLKIYNVLGQEVATVINREQMDEGLQEFEFNASRLASGVYFYRIMAEGIADPDNGITGQTYVAVKKMLLLK
jgi:hypothetical protein